MKVFLDFSGFLCYVISMIKLIDTRKEILESRIEGIHHAIAKMRKDATPATHATVEMAIEMLALPELKKIEAQLAEVLAEKSEKSS